jgi:hypothetical protein
VVGAPQAEHLGSAGVTFLQASHHASLIPASNSPRTLQHVEAVARRNTGNLSIMAAQRSAGLALRPAGV